MPELSEVEITRRRIVPHVVGRTIASVATTRDSAFFLTRSHVLCRRLAGCRIDILDRIGKYLLAGLIGGERLLLHLGMIGQIFVVGVPGVRLLFVERGSNLPPKNQGEAFQ